METLSLLEKDRFFLRNLIIAEFLDFNADVLSAFQILFRVIVMVLRLNLLRLRSSMAVFTSYSLLSEQLMVCILLCFWKNCRFLFSYEAEM